MESGMLADLPVPQIREKARRGNLIKRHVKNSTAIKKEREEGIDLQ